MAVPYHRRIYTAQEVAFLTEGVFAIGKQRQPPLGCLTKIPGTPVNAYPYGYLVMLYACRAIILNKVTTTRLLFSVGATSIKRLRRKKFHPGWELYYSPYTHQFARIPSPECLKRLGHKNFWQFLNLDIMGLIHIDQEPLHRAIDEMSKMERFRKK